MNYSGYNPAQKGREWQMKAAMFGFLSAFGREDPARNDTLYMTTEDVRSMIMVLTFHFVFRTKLFYTN